MRVCTDSKFSSVAEVEPEITEPRSQFPVDSSSQMPARTKTPKYECKCSSSGPFHFSPKTRLPSKLVVSRIIFRIELDGRFIFTGMPCLEERD